MDTTDEETLDRYFNWDFTDEEIGMFRALIRHVQAGLKDNRGTMAHYIPQETLDILKCMLFVMEN